MPINSEMLKNFEQGFIDDINMANNSPYLIEEDMIAISQSILKRNQNGHKSPISLILTENMIGDKGVEHLKKCSTIKFDYIELSDNQLTDDSANIFAKMKIVTLSLNSNSITDDGAFKLADSKHIEELALRGTDITDIGVEKILHNKNIKTLFISEDGSFSKKVLASVQSLNKKTEEEEEQDEDKEENSSKKKHEMSSIIQYPLIRDKNISIGLVEKKETNIELETVSPKKKLKVTPSSPTPLSSPTLFSSNKSRDTSNSLLPLIIKNSLQIVLEELSKNPQYRTAARDFFLEGLTQSKQLIPRNRTDSS
jgi:hypothetical protein